MVLSEKTTKNEVSIMTKEIWKACSRFEPMYQGQEVTGKKLLFKCSWLHDIMHKIFYLTIRSIFIRILLKLNPKEKLWKFIFKLHFFSSSNQTNSKSTSHVCICIHQSTMRSKLCYEYRLSFHVWCVLNTNEWLRYWPYSNPSS